MVDTPFWKKGLMMKKTIIGQVVKFTFDGGLEPVEFDCAKLSAANREYAVPFAMCHRLGDAAAIPKSAENGYTITEQMRREEVAGLAAHYASGSDQWNVKASARAPTQNPAILKLATALGLTYEETQAKLVADAMAALGA